MERRNSAAGTAAPQDFIQFQDATFAYPPAAGQEGEASAAQPIFRNCTATLPGGFVSLVGPNASGKSTFMLLAAGRLLPQAGTILLLGADTKSLSEEERNRRASFIYQNMEFDTEAPVAQLLEQVYRNGAFAGSCPPVAAGDAATAPRKDVLEQVSAVLELEGLQEKPLASLSKGQMQRVILAFSLLYGSKSIFMDEPLFALETSQKHKILGYIKSYCTELGIPVYISMHELELSRMYPDNVLLFYPNRDMDFGTPEEVLTAEALEKAYGVPVAMLKDAESLTRKNLQEQYGCQRR